VHRSKFFDDARRIFDLLIVMMDVLFLMISAFLSSRGLLTVLVLRVFRLARLSRAMKVLGHFPELAMMLRGLSSALRATFWGSCIVILAILMWSIFSEKFLHPLNQEITKAGIYSREGCSHCPQAWSSEWNAFITMTQHVVAGDAWGDVNRPMVKYAPYTLFIFVAMNFSINLLILNLIAIVVERANIAHEEDTKVLQKQAENEAVSAQAQLFR